MGDHLFRGVILVEIAFGLDRTDPQLPDRVTAVGDRGVGTRPLGGIIGGHFRGAGQRHQFEIVKLGLGPVPTAKDLRRGVGSSLERNDHRLPGFARHFCQGGDLCAGHINPDHAGPFDEGAQFILRVRIKRDHLLEKPGFLADLGRFQPGIVMPGYRGGILVRIKIRPPAPTGFKTVVGQRLSDSGRRNSCQRSLLQRMPDLHVVLLALRHRASQDSRGSCGVSNSTSSRLPTGQPDGCRVYSYSAPPLFRRNRRQAPAHR